MNFKKYHVSRNLFDSDVLLEAVGWEKNDNIYSGYSSALHSKFNSFDKCIQVDSAVVSMNIMFKYVNINTSLFIVFWYTDGTSTSASKNAKAGEWTYFSAKSDSNKTLKGIAFSYGTNDIVELKEIMLNSGSTALPYEPYSSEVWHDTPHYIHNTSTDTITTLPAVVYPNAATATVGLKGQAVQSGTPTPDNPIMPQSCGERTGNLFETILPLMNISNNGTITSDRSNLFDLWIAKVTAGETYTASAVGGCYGFYASQPTAGSVSIDGSRILTYDTIVFTVPNGANYIAVRYNKNSTRKMCNSGSTLLPYEPFGVKIPISSADTTTPVYLGEVQTVRQIKKFVLTGEESETWSYNTILRNGNGFYNQFIFTGYKANSGAGYCTHYPLATELTATIGVLFGSNINFITDFAEGIDTAEKWRDYLRAQYAAGTPVCVWYVLAAEETGIVNEPLMRIGDYADTLSNVSIPVTTGTNTLSVGTTVQPSEVTVNYKGWHPVADVHEKSTNLVFSYLDDSSIRTDDGTIINNYTYDLAIAPVIENETYTISTNYDSGNCVYGFFTDIPVSRSVTYNGSRNVSNLTSFTITAPISGYVAFWSRNDENIRHKSMLNLGSEALPYEPYWK